MHKAIEKQLGSELRNQLKTQAKRDVLLDISEDLFLQALDPQNKELSLTKKLNLAQTILKLNPDIALFSKNSGNVINMITYAVKEAVKTEKKMKKAKGEVIVPKVQALVAEFGRD